MDYYTDHFASHTSAVEALADAGIAPPPEWTRVALRYKAFATESGGSALGSLTDAVVNGTKADTDVLRALAIAESLSTPVVQASIRNHVKSAVLSALYAAYAPHAQANYIRAAETFDGVASRLAAAAVLVDLESSADSIITAGEAVRSAWADGLLASRELDSATKTLTTAAALAGVSAAGDEGMIALTVDPGDITRRTLWELWDATPGRCGRWSALLAAGCTIRAHRDLTTFEPYRRARPLEERWIPAGRGSSRRVMIDPEETEESSPKRRASAL